MINNYYYEFADGYRFWSVGRISKSDKNWEIKKHGKLIVEKQVR